MNIKYALSVLIQDLKESNIATYSVDALLILKKVTGLSDVFLLSNPEYKLSKKEVDMLYIYLKKRKNRYPMAYITNSKEFYGFEFYVNENVLIPRPETELLVDETIDLAKQFDNPAIIDIATGSGCIAISLSKVLNINIAASDLSFEALKVAQFNANKNQADVDFIAADMLSFLRKRVNIIVSNPPYIEEESYEFLQQDVKFEPKQALTCKNGTYYIEKLIQQSKHLCNYLIIEIGFNQEDFVKRFDNLICVKKDLSNNPRVAVFKFIQ